MNQPKILLFDIETTPVKAWIWRTGKQWVNHESIVDGQRFEIICIAYKWADKKQVYCLDWGKTQNSAKMIDEFVKVLESADVVLGQNSNSFDVKQINTQRMLHGQPPIAWPTAEDTRRQILSKFYVTSSSLEYMSKLLTGSGKDKMAFGDWVEIVDGKSSKALAKMKKYCKKDVLKLEAVWKKIRPYVKQKANRGIIRYGRKENCHACASPRVHSHGFRYTAAAKIKRFQCHDCGHVF